MDFALRRARADDGKADDDLGTATEGATDYLTSWVADFVNNVFVGRFRLRCDNEPSIMHVERVVSRRSGQRMTEITCRRLFRLQKLSCSRSVHQNIVDCR